MSKNNLCNNCKNVEITGIRVIRKVRTGTSFTILNKICLVKNISLHNVEPFIQCNSYKLKTN